VLDSTKNGSLPTSVLSKMPIFPRKKIITTLASRNLIDHDNSESENGVVREPSGHEIERRQYFCTILKVEVPSS
jgi:hypothetical protein